MEADFNAVFLDAEGKVQSLPTHDGGLALLVGFQTLENGWTYLGREPLNPLEFRGLDGEEKPGTKGGSAG